MTDRLMDLLGFTPGDLAHNRRGMLSPEQEVAVARDRRRLKRGVFVIGLILLAIAAVWIVLFAQLRETSASIVAIVVGAVVFGLPGLALLYLGVRRAPPIVIEEVRGPARVARVEHTTSSSNGGTRRVVNTEMHLGDRIFVVPDAAFSELEDGADYAVYAWKGTKDIFSLEKL